MTFKDYFSRVADRYRSFRPTYPAGLFEHLAMISPARDLAWDCATGNGQVAVALSDLFGQVVATDGSQSQINSAVRVANVTYRTETAERSSLEDSSVDLLTVGQALHWFDVPAFEAEAARALKPGGVLAVWSYAILESEPGIDAVIHDLYERVLGEFWTPERRAVEDGYRGFEFDLSEMPVPVFAMTANWDLAHMMGYLSTWSATKRYEQTNGSSALDIVSARLAEAWGEAERVVEIRWPLSVRAWKKRN